MIEILNDTGRIVGWLDETEMNLPSREHRRYFGLPLIVSMAADRRFNQSILADATLTKITLRWHCLEFFRTAKWRNPDGSRGKDDVGSKWYLVADEIPADTWKAKGFVQCGDDWLKR